MWPIAFIIGIDTDECQEAAKLIGLKIFATEVLAYQELGKSTDAGLLSVSGFLYYISNAVTC
jgi:pyrimidine nucleoside transport protein